MNRKPIRMRPIYNGKDSAFRIQEFRNFNGFKNPNQ